MIGVHGPQSTETVVTPGQRARAMEQGGSAAPPTTLFGAWAAGYAACINEIAAGRRPVNPYPQPQ